MNINKSTRCYLFLILLVAPFTAIAQIDSSNDQSFIRKSVDINKTTLSPVLDGNLDDEIWQQATLITDLHQTLPVDHGEPTRASEFYVTYSDDYFYVAARLYDDQPSEINARQLIQGGNLGFDDNIEIMLDTFNNSRTAFYFRTNPNSIRNEGVWESPSSSNNDWSGIWQVESRIDDQGWVAEIAIPFKTLNFDPNTEQWGFNIGRTIARSNEQLFWSSLNRESNPSTAGTISGVSGINQGLGLDIVPSMILTRTEDHISGDTDDNFDPSLDVFYKFTPNLTGVLTLNTDFSATEVDNRQVNLTRFSLFFPEKRDFFLQDSEIFSFSRSQSTFGFGGGQNAIPFYSRRIGLNSATGQPVGIDAGAKLAGRIGNISLGSLVVKQDDQVGLEGQNVFVGRIASNVLSESKVGVIFTDGDPNSELDNSLIGVDFSYQNTRFSDSHTLSSNVWYQQTTTEGIEGDDKAYNFDVALTTQNNGLSGSLNYSYIGEEYNPALGFVNRKGIETFGATTNYYYYPVDNSFLRILFGLLQYSHVRSIETQEMESEEIVFIPFSLNSHRGDRYNVIFDQEKENLSRPFAIRPGIIIPAGEYSFHGAQLNLLTSNQRDFSPDLSYKQGSFYDGTRREVSLSMAWRPNRNLAFDFSYRFTDVELPQGDFVSRLISVNANYAVNAKWSWLNLIQYDNGSKSVGLNSRLHWAPQAGEDLYLVVNYNFDSLLGAFKDLDTVYSSVVLKYTKNFRF